MAKFDLHILSVIDNADTLKVEAQGVIGHGEWAPWKVMTLVVPATVASRQAFYVGRELSVTITPKEKRRAR